MLLANIMKQRVDFKLGIKVISCCVFLIVFVTITLLFIVLTTLVNIDNF